MKNNQHISTQMTQMTQIIADLLSIRKPSFFSDCRHILATPIFHFAPALDIRILLQETLNGMKTFANAIPQ